MNNTLLICFLLITSSMFAQTDSIPVIRGLNTPITNHPDSNSIYNEQQGYPDTIKKTTEEDKEQIMQPVKKKSGINSPAPKNKPKQIPYKNKKTDTDTTGKGSKQDF